MKKRKLTALTIVILVVLLAFSACTISSQPAGSESSSTAEESPAPGGEPEGNSAGAEGPLGKYDPPIKVVTALSGLDATVKDTEDNNPDNNIWSRAYKDELGIETENLWAVNGPQADDKINLAIASGEIPDIFRVNQVQFQQLLNAGMIEDITGAYDQYAGDFMKDVMTRPGSETAIKASSKDGKLYGIPYFLNMTDDTRVIYIRGDWMEKLNIPEPETFDDLMNIAKKFKDEDPDGNGTDDTMGLALDSKIFESTSGVFKTIMNCMGANPFGWVEEDGKLVYGLAQSEPMKKGLGRLAQMYAEGYIRPDFTSYSWDDQFTPDILNNKIGITFGGLWEGWWPLGEMKKTDENVEWKMYPVLSDGDKPAKSLSTEIVINGITVVKKGFAHPEAVVKMANLCNEKMWKSDAETFNAYGYDSAGNNPWLYCPVYFEFPGKNYTLYQKTSAALETGKTDELNGEEELIYGWMKEYVDGTDLGRWGIYLSYGPGSSCSLIDYYLENDLYEYNKFYGTPPKSQLDNESILNALFTEYAMKIVTGEYPVEQYDEFVEQWYLQGGEAWTKDVNDWYAEIK